MLKNKGNFFILETEHTSLLLQTEGTAGYLYYGERLSDYTGAEGLLAQTGAPLSLFSQWGKTDFREPSLLIRHADGSVVSDFRLRSAKIAKRVLPEGLPASYGEEKCLRLEFIDAAARLKYVLQYVVYADSDTVAVSSFLTNVGKKTVQIERISSLQLELRGCFSFTSFDGAWGCERHRHSRALNGGVCENASFGGSSSHFRNPFVMLSNAGGCYGFNLVYSGNHREIAEEDDWGRTRLITGINPFDFSWELGEGETFFAPEAVMCYGKTEEETGARMRRFVSRHIVREKWREKERPVLVNNWEGTYFSFTREKILAIAQRAAQAGAELFVLDDGWFGRRDDDCSSLGDWTDYSEKTGGLETLADEIRAMGLSFGIWVEPEMISENSELYRKHPEYCMRVPKREPTRMRNQLMLNLADPQVQGFVFRAVSRVITQTKASYVKWDYNRYMTDCFDKGTRGGEYLHRYMLGLYSVLGKLIERYPKVLFEGCASGGGRFDLGMLRYTPQIWTSDNTDARERIAIQAGTAAGYPQSSMGAHVTASPNEQTGNRNSLYTRFCIACGGVLGYESDLSRATEEELREIAAQIAFYKEYRRVLQFGTYHALGESGRWAGFLTAEGGRAVAVVAAFEKRTYQKSLRVSFAGLDARAIYRVSIVQRDCTLREICVASGDLLNKGSVCVDDMFDTERECNPVYTRMFVLEKITKKALDRELRP